MWNDEIIEEVRKVRLEYAAKFNHDLDAIYKDIKQQEEESDHQIVSRPPKKPELVALITR